MKGVREKDVKKVKERQDFIRDLFLKDCKERAKEGFIDAAMSAPRAQREFKKRFKVYLNSQQLYKLRKSVFNEFGLDDNGRPMKRSTDVHEITAVNRDPGDPLFHVAIVPTRDSDQGQFLKAALTTLAERGLVDPQLRVDGVHTHYATVSRFPAE